MAITNKQEPINIHSVFLPEYYTYQTDTTGTTNFYFDYHLNDVYTEFFVGNTVPLDDYISYNDPTEVLKSKTLFSFNPSITTISNIEENIIVYIETIQEVGDTGTTLTFTTKSACRYSDPDFDPYDYIMNSGQSQVQMPDFLVSMPNQHRIRYTDDFTFRTYNGYLDSESTGATYLADVSSYILEFFFSSSSVGISSAKFRSFNTNPIFQYTQSSSLTATTSGSNYMIELPAAINNCIYDANQFILISFVWDGEEYEGSEDVVEPIFITSDFELEEFQTQLEEPIPTYVTGIIDYYDYWAITDRDYDQISIKHRFYPINDCTFTSINVAWENTKGGVDYYLFEKANEKTIQSEKTTYDQNTYYLNLTDEEVQKIPYDKRTTVYRNVVTSSLELNTDWLTQDEIDGFEDLFKSTEVYINYKGSWIYVISVEKKAVIYNKKRKGLKKYKLNFQLSEKSIRY